MATSAFRSTTKRSCAPKSKPTPSTHPRRSRSLSRPTSAAQNGQFLDISLDDLAEEFLRARAESDEESEAASVATARSAGRGEAAGFMMETESSRGRGREVSRIDCGRNSVRGDGVDIGKWRRRSVSVARGENGVASRSNQIKPRSSDNTKLQQSSSQKPAKTSHGLRRTMSDKDFLLSQDSNSNHSSLTDDETHDFRPSIYGEENTISALKKAEHLIGDDGSIGLYEAMQKEFRHSVEDIHNTELEKVIVKPEPAAIISGDDISPKSSEVLQAAIVKIRRNYNRKLEQSQKRKQELLALLAAEEETGKELSKIVKEMQPSPENTATTERGTRSRKRSNDRMKMSKCLTEEAERYLEDFLSNVEDTDLSSFDGERSDTGSSLRERIQHCPDVENHVRASKSAPVPVDADGAMLPWLQWENSSNLSIQCKPQAGGYTVAGNISSFALQEDDADSNNLHLERSQRSWKTEGNGISCGHTKECKVEVYSFIAKSRVCSFKMEDYSNLRQSEDFLVERLRHRTSIDSGSMILCERIWL